MITQNIFIGFSPFSFPKIFKSNARKTWCVILVRVNCDIFFSESLHSTLRFLKLSLIIKSKR